MKITEFLKDNRLFLDGGMGTLLQAQGLAPGELPERWNLTHPDTIRAVHRAYFDAGSHVVCTNTFGANGLKFSPQELSDIVEAAVGHARAAAAACRGAQPTWVALDIGPTGRMLKPYGDLDFEDAVKLFSEVVRLGVRFGVDLIYIETMTDSYETKAATLAAKECCELPVFVSCAYGEDGKLMTGASPEAMVAMLEGLGVDAVGVNCSLGPEALSDVVQAYIRCASVPVLLKPNAGLPVVRDGASVYDISPDVFAAEIASLVQLGVRLVGGCCGTTPVYIQAVVNATRDLPLVPVEPKGITCISSYTHALTFDRSPVLIGERINPTGKAAFKQALRAGDMGYILREGIAQQEAGAQVLDVNVGLPEIDECDMLTRAVCELQAIIPLPLQIDTSNIQAMKAALRRYNGKPMLNSVNGTTESMQAVLPLAKKYGALVVALTLDESGIPASAEGRLAIARRILAQAQAYGIDKKDIIFDPLAMAVSADSRAAAETLRAVQLIRTELGCHTSLGVSNVSFGLPARDVLNSTFFTLAMGQGLSAAIMNPYSAEMMKAYTAFRALAGLDDSLGAYIDFAEGLTSAPVASTDRGAVAKTASNDGHTSLMHAIIKGLKEQAAVLTEQLLTQTDDPLSLVDAHIIPALNTVGQGFEQKRIYLPQLLMSAEAAKAAAEVLRAHMPAEVAEDGVPFVLATVKGDIHDIGKNIVKLLLENYGFAVCDLGRDTPVARVVEATVRLHAPFVGLSALMTTTIPAMRETIDALREAAPWCRIVVGGAVLTEEYARSIGADAYAADAMQTVRYAQQVLESK